MGYKFFFRYQGGAWNKFITLKRGMKIKCVCFNTKIVLIQFIITAPFMVQKNLHTSLASLSHKRFDHCSSSLPCRLAVALCVVILFLFMSSWGGVHDDTNIQRMAVRQTIAQHIKYTVHVIIFKLVVLWWGMKHWDRYLDGVPNIIRQFFGGMKFCSQN